MVRYASTPNHAADPIVTRWHKNDKKSRKVDFVLIKRKDTGEWAFPGGMVEYGDSVSLTLKKEFMEETQNIQKKIKTNTTSDKFH